MIGLHNTYFTQTQDLIKFVSCECFRAVISILGLGNVISALYATSDGGSSQCPFMAIYHTELLLCTCIYCGA